MPSRRPVGRRCSSHASPRTTSTWRRRSRRGCARWAPPWPVVRCCSSPTSSSTTRRPSSTPTRGSSPPPCWRCDGSARPSVLVAEGPGHRRDTPFVVSASGLGERLGEVGARFVDLNLRTRDPRPAPRSVHRARRAVAARAGRRRRRRDLDAEDEDAPLGGRHPVDEELFRVRARPHLRLAEERAPLGGAAGGDRRRGLGRASRAADRRRDRRDGGQRPDRRDARAGRRAGVRDRSGRDRLDRGGRDGPGSGGDLARERGRAGSSARPIPSRSCRSARTPSAR